jgi:HAD superfamily hydrolase (TIGR01450 family)
MKVLMSLMRWYEQQPVAPDAVVLDIDGVLILQRQPLPGALALIDRLRKDNVPFSLLTNAADESVEERLAVLAAAGFDLEAARITSAGHPLEDLTLRENLRGSLFFMMAKLGNPCYAEAAGLEITRQVRDLERCRGVVVGEGPSDWRTEVTAVVNFLRKHPEAPLICPNPDPFFPGQAGEIHIGSGGVTSFIIQILTACGVDIKPRYLGKPYAPVFERNHRRMEAQAGCTIDRSKTIMIGDMLEGDILGGNSFGYRTALLLTGGTKRSMVPQSTTRPDVVFEGI